jgi:hypothetical protein
MISRGIAHSKIHFWGALAHGFKGLKPLIVQFSYAALKGRSFTLVRNLILDRQKPAERCSAWTGEAPVPTRSYWIISLIVPAPTVWPPSRMAKRSPFSMATGVINSITNCTLSPGITISVPLGNSATPVTSVVLR